MRNCVIYADEAEKDRYFFDRELHKQEDFDMGCVVAGVFQPPTNASFGAKDGVTHLVISERYYSAHDVMKGEEIKPFKGKGVDTVELLWIAEDFKHISTREPRLTSAELLKRTADNQPPSSIPKW